MRFLDFLVLIILFALLVAGMYFLWLNFPTESSVFEEYVANFSGSLPFESLQFYSNMRYPDKIISYSLSENCSSKKQNDFTKALNVLEEKTVLSFYESENPEIIISCANIIPKPDEEGHFVAGEGGPSVIVNATKFAVITLGKIALYNPEICDTPQVSLHELLHALGFEHNSNPKSIMFPVTDCEQTLDQSIIDEINRLYTTESSADLVIEKIAANKTGRYLNFEAVASNQGLKDLKESFLKVIVEGEKIKEFEMGELTIGSKKSLTLTNLRIPRDTEKIDFLLETPEKEITKENNVVSISVQG